MDAALVTAATAGAVAVQTGLMLVDELVFHRRRGLGLFETIGHPVDAAIFLAAVAVPALAAPTDGAVTAFAVLGLLSMLVITKDEWVHAKACAPAEHWLHALLFVLHAPILAGVYLTWRAAPDALLLRMLPLTVSGWMAYQIIYWVTYHVRRNDRRAAGDADGAPGSGGEQRVLRRAGRPVV